jgi:hypothetical protein
MCREAATRLELGNNSADADADAGCVTPGTGGQQLRLPILLTELNP